MSENKRIQGDYNFTSVDGSDTITVNASEIIFNTDITTNGTLSFLLDEDNLVSNSSTHAPSQQSIRQYVDTTVAVGSPSGMNFYVNYDVAANNPDLDTAPSGVTLGNVYVASTDGLFFTAAIETGDVLISKIDNPAALTDWTIVSKKLSQATISTLGIIALATTTEVNTGTNNVKAVTPLGIEAFDGSAQILTVGVLDSGSITANFGNIDIGTSAFSSDTVTALNTVSGNTLTGTTLIASTLITAPSGSWDVNGIDLLNSDTFAIAGVDVLTSTTLGTSVVNSSLTNVGTLTAGVWNGTVIAEAYLENQGGTNTGDEPAASTTVVGVTRLATPAETQSGIINSIANTPAGLNAWPGTANVVQVGALASGSIAVGFGTINIGTESITSGDIITSGTVDGRDVAADGTKLDTIETNADVTDVVNVELAGAVMEIDTSTINMDFVIDEDDMISDLSTKVPTQQSVKAYVDTSIASDITYKGSYDAATDAPILDGDGGIPIANEVGDMYIATVAGTFFTKLIEIGDTLIAETLNPIFIASGAVFTVSTSYTIVTAGDNTWTDIGAAATTPGTIFTASGTTTAGATGTAIATPLEANWTVVNKNIDAATTVTPGITRFATQAETSSAATDETIAVTPGGLNTWPGNASVTLVGVLDGGSITSNFGTINNGTSAITTSGLITGGTITSSGLFTSQSGTWDAGGIDLLTTNTYAIAGQDVLNATTLGTAVVTSSLTTVGTIGTGVWNGTVITSAYLVAASETVAGVLEIATQIEADAGTGTNLAVTADKLEAWNGGTGIATVGTVTTGSIQGINVGGTTPVINFTSTGIDDNATGERLQLADTIMSLGAAAVPYAITHTNNDRSLAITGGTTTSNGANVTLYGGIRATLANDIDFKADAASILYYDNSATNWNFQAANTVDIYSLSLPATPAAVPGTPTLRFGDGDTGFYESADDVLQLSTAGGILVQFAAGGITINANSNRAYIKNSDPTATNPVLCPRNSDADTGLGTSAADQLSLIAGGVEGIRISEANTNISIASGEGASALIEGQQSYASGSFAAAGDAQQTKFICRGSTTDATSTNINPSGTTTNGMILTANSAWGFNIQVTVREAATGDTKYLEFKGCIKRDGANVTALVGSITKDVLAEDAGTTAWDAAVTADNTAEALQIAVTGEAAHTLRWVAVVSISEVVG